MYTENEIKCKIKTILNVLVIKYNKTILVQDKRSVYNKSDLTCKTNFLGTAFPRIYWPV